MEIEQFLPELGHPAQLRQAIYCIILSSLHYHMGFELSLTKIIHYVTALPNIYIMSHDSVVHYTVQ